MKKSRKNQVPAVSIIDLNGDDWYVGEGAHPTAWLPARVPGNVQEDLWRNNKKPDPYFGENAAEYRDTEKKFWSYKKAFMFAPGKNELNWFLVFDSVDYKADFFLNNEKIGSHEGMFSEVRLAVGHALTSGCNEVKVVIHPLAFAPHASRAHINKDCLHRHDGRWMAKSLMSFDWDFAPRFVPTGIWKDVRLEGKNGVRLHSPRVDMTFNSDHSSVDLVFLADADVFEHNDYTVRLSLYEGTLPRGKTGGPKPALRLEAPVSLNAFNNEVKLAGAFKKPKLWWPLNMGVPFLYTAEMTIRNRRGEVDTIRFNVGLRSFKMIRSPADSQAALPLPSPALNNETVMAVNGRAFFYKGVNFVPMDILFGRIDNARIKTQMDLVKDANIQLLRVWGGGIVNRDYFYELADQYGILIWQEFPLGCTDHEGNPQYRDILGHEAGAIIKQLRHHPSIALWCGGNELFQPQSGMAPFDRIIRMLGAISYECDPERIFFPSSPYPGALHGPYTFDMHGAGLHGGSVDHVQYCNDLPNGAYNECGISGAEHAWLIEKCLPKDEIWPPAPKGSWEFHKGFNAWQKGDSWMCLALVEKYFGPLKDLADLCRASQFLQAIGLQYLCEELRRRWPNITGSMPWCFNYPWTTVAGSDIVAYPDVPKPAYFTIQKTYAPLAVSARLQHFVLVPGEETQVEVHCCNDSMANAVAGTIALSLTPLDNNDALFKKTRAIAPVASMARLCAGPFTIKLPDDAGGVYELAVSWKTARMVVSTRYWLGIGASGKNRLPAGCYAPLLAYWNKDKKNLMPGMY